MASVYILSHAAFIPYPILSLDVASSRHSLAKSDLKVSKSRVYRVSIKSGNTGYYTEYFINVILQLSKIVSRFLDLLDIQIYYSVSHTYVT